MRQYTQKSGQHAQNGTKSYSQSLTDSLFPAAAAAALYSLTDSLFPAVAALYNLTDILFPAGRRGHIHSIEEKILVHKNKTFITQI